MNENVRLQAAKTWADYLHFGLQATHGFLHLLDICGPQELKSKKLIIFHFCIEGLSVDHSCSQIEWAILRGKAYPSLRGRLVKYDQKNWSREPRGHLISLSSHMDTSTFLGEPPSPILSPVDQQG